MAGEHPSLTVRRLTPDDYAVVKSVRLRSLTLAPSAFGSTFEREAEFTDDEWRHRLRSAGFPHFACFDESGKPAGLVVAAPDEDDHTTAHLFAMWVEPTARGAGTADALVAEVTAWARAQDCSAVQLLVTEGNDRAERMYRRNGFERSGQSRLRERDNAREIEMVCNLLGGVTL